MNPIHLWPEPPRPRAGQTLFSAKLESPGGPSADLWFRLPVEHAHGLAPSADAFVVGSLFLAMSRKADLIVHGAVSPSLLRNLDEFQTIWACWRPGVLHRVTLRADHEREQADDANRAGALAVFSGGVDSCHTALRHARDTAGRHRRDLRAALMVQGFDIPLEDEVAFARAAERSRRMLASLGVPLLTLATNYRELLPLPWPDVFAPGLAASLLLFQGRFTCGLIPASFSYHKLVLPYGSNPLTDRLLGGDRFEILHDGADLSRAEKIRRVAAWPEALAHLRVCWEGAAKDRNCGRCEKCVRTILNFRVIGVHAPRCFDHDPTDADIRRTKAQGAALVALQNLLRSAEAAKVHDSWVGALRVCLRRNQRLEAMKAWVSPPMRQRLKHMAAGLRRWRPAA